jgi:hypothetical protein
MPEGLQLLASISLMREMFLKWIVIDPPDALYVQIVGITIDMCLYAHYPAQNH